MPDAPPPPNDTSRDLPKGLIFSSFRRSSSRGRYRLGVVTIVLVAGASLVWPIYPLFGSIRPYVAQLPLSLAWVVAWLVIVFLALGVLFVREEM